VAGDSPAPASRVLSPSSGNPFAAEGCGGRLIPQMTQVALQTHKKDLMRETPNFAKQKFLYRLSRSDYEKE
jgi:hypothetical protein